jgi:hypothetical protein
VVVDGAGSKEDIGGRVKQIKAQLEQTTSEYDMAWHYTFLHGSTRGMKCIVNTVFLFFHFNFSGSTHFNNGNSWQR